MPMRIITTPRQACQMTLRHRDVAIWATIVFAASAAAYFIDQGESVNSRLPVLLTIAIAGRVAIRLTGVDRRPGTARSSHIANLIVLAVLVAVSIPILIASL
jgi:hypothetical protein